MTTKQEVSIDQTKDVTAESQKFVPEEGGEKTLELAQPCTTANDMWVCPRGTFIMRGTRGTANYEFGGQRYNTTWTFSDCYSVGSRVGWTYKEDGFTFYMFLSKGRSDKGFELLWSTNNQAFNHYCWAD